MCFKESSDGETLMAVGIWFQIWGAAEEKAWRPKYEGWMWKCHIIQSYNNQVWTELKLLQDSNRYH